MYVEWVGVGEFNAALEAMVPAAKVAAQVAGQAAGRVIKAAASSHVRSKSGALVGSIVTVPSGPGSVDVGPTIIYGRRHELGYGHRYPYLAPGLREAEPAVAGIYYEAWAAVV